MENTLTTGDLVLAAATWSAILISMHYYGIYKAAGWYALKIVKFVLPQAIFNPAPKLPELPELQERVRSAFRDEVARQRVEERAARDEARRQDKR